MWRCLVDNMFAVSFSFFPSGRLKKKKAEVAGSAVFTRDDSQRVGHTYFLNELVY